VNDVIPIWGGFECSIVRIGDETRDQNIETGHDTRDSDLDLAPSLGLQALRFPVLWEHVAPQGLDRPNWQHVDRRLSRLRARQVPIIAGLLHHGSGPLYTHLLDPHFPKLLAQYAGMVARRYPWIKMFTPVNEPLTTARFSCLYGHWYPHARNTRSFLRATFNQTLATCLAMASIREVSPDAELVQTEELGRVFATDSLKHQADYENARRWLSLDLLWGRVDEKHDWFEAFLDAGVEKRLLQLMVEAPSKPDTIGLNYYLSSDRFLDHRPALYPASARGGNGRDIYADIEAVRVDDPSILCDVSARLLEVWQRYKAPVALTEIHNGCTREEQLRWLLEAYRGAQRARSKGANVRALTVWGLAGMYDWDSMLTRRSGNYESSVLDVGGPGVRQTALGNAVSALASGQEYRNPVVNHPGWWRRDFRFYNFAGAMHVPPRPSGGSLMIIKDGATLGRAFARVCETRGLPAHLIDHTEIDLTNATCINLFDHHRPWAVIYAAGPVRVDAAGGNTGRWDSALIAGACAAREIQFMSFSSDAVFDGELGRPYVETDAPTPSGVYGTGMAEAEQDVLQAFPEALVIRTGAVFSPWDRHNFVYNVLSTLKTGQVFAGVPSGRVTPSYVPDLVNRALDLLIDAESGLWHLANAGGTSWYDFARSAAAAAALNSDLIAAPPDGRDSTELASERGSLLPPLHHAITRFWRDIEVI
jgi:dTDP-4-dehydrorhamnose reductase